MSSKSLTDYTVQELLERAIEFDNMAAQANAPQTKHTLASFAARFRSLAAWRASRHAPHHAQEQRDVSATNS